MKILYSLIIIGIFLFFINVAFALTEKSSTHFIYGTFKYIEHTKKDSRFAIVSYLQHKNYVRLDTQEGIYYIIDLNQEKAEIVNPKRKTVTVLPASKMVRYKLPPLFVFKNADNLKQYLTNHQATLLKKPDDKASLEKRNLKLDKFEYLLTIKLPEYYLKRIEIINASKKVELLMINRFSKPVSKLVKNSFLIPANYKTLDLR